MAAKSKLTRQQLKDNMKKEATRASGKARMKSESEKASAKAKSAADPTPKKFQGANRAAAKASTPIDMEDAPGSGPVESAPSPAKTLFERLRGSKPAAPEPSLGSETGTGWPDSPAAQASQPPAPRGGPVNPGAGGGSPNYPGFNGSKGWDAAAKAEGRASMGRTAGSISGLLGIGAALAAIRDNDPEGFDQHVKDFLNPAATARNIGEIGDGGEGRMARNIANHPMQYKSPTTEANPIEVPNAADIRAMSSQSSGAASPDKGSAKAVRAQAKSKASSVRETGGPLTDQEIIDWNRKNNKNYRD